MAFIERNAPTAVAVSENGGEVEVAPLSDVTLALEDAPDPEEAASESIDHAGIVRFVLDKFKRAEDARQVEENRWLEDFRNYRGVYGPGTRFSDAEKSRVFVKVTKTKVLAAYGQLIDVLLAGNRFPIGIEARRQPVGDVAAALHVDPQAPPDGQEPEPEDPYGWEGDGRDEPADPAAQLGPMEEWGELGWKPGEGQTPTAVTIRPADIAAARMEKRVHDALDESHAVRHLRNVAFEAALFGTGVLAGPFLSTKEYPKWAEGGRYEPESRKVPRMEHVSIWDIYPDPDAHDVEHCEYVVRRRKMGREQLRGLKRRPFFRDEAIEALISRGPSYDEKFWEQSLRDASMNFSVERWEVLEFWGYMDRAMAEDAGLEIPEELEDHDTIEVNAWVSDGLVIRLVLNPFTPARIPYFIVPFELNPYSIFGTGVASNMADVQEIMNGFMRMTVDNAALSGNLMIEIDETNLAPGQDMRVFPGKTWRRNGGPPGQAIFGTKWPNVTGENLQVFDKARQLADEATGIPSYSHGQTGVSGVGRTAAGISMLMGASSTSIKSTVKNFDDYLLAPLGRALFSWMMQFDHDPEIKGDLEVVARGTESLLRNEVRSQRLMTFMQIAASNPALAPLAKFPYILREIAKVLDLDPEKVTNDPAEAQLQAMLMQMAGGGGAGQPAPDMSGNGGGNIGLGGVPTPGEPGFTGGPPGMGGPGPMGAAQPPQAGVGGPG